MNISESQRECNSNSLDNTTMNEKASKNKTIIDSSLILNNDTLVESSVIDDNGYPTTKEATIEKENKNLPHIYEDDLDNPKVNANDLTEVQNWSRRRKSICMTVILINSFIPYFSSAIYIPATHDMMRAFNTDLTSITSTFSFYLLMCGIWPLYWAPLSQRVGRKWVFVIGMLFYTICSVLCAVSVGFIMFYVFRVLQALFASSALALGGGSISDIAKPSERGKLMSYYIFVLVVSAPIGTVLGGFIDEYLGFRYIFYLLAIYGGTATLITFFFLEETLYFSETKSKPKFPSDLKSRLKTIFAFNPQKTIFMAIFQSSVPFGCYYYFLASLPLAFPGIYNFTPQEVGLCSIGGGIGSCVGSLVSGSLSDMYCARVAKKRNGVRIEETRLRLGFIALPLTVVGSLMYGWFLHIKLHWIAPVIALAVSSFGIIFITTINVAYLIDANPKAGASVTALNTFIRSLCSMVFSFASVKMRDTMGDGWTSTFLGLLSAMIVCVTTSLLLKYGKSWRSCTKAENKPLH